MKILKTYTDTTNNNIYTIEKILVKEITSHCKLYFDFVSESTNTNFHSSEISLHAKLLEKCIISGEAIKVCINGIDICWVYAHRESRRALNIALLYTNNYELVPKAKILIINYLQNKKLTLRYTPKDIWIYPNTTLLNTISLKVLRDNLTESVKMKPPGLLWGNDILSYLNLKELL